MIVGLLIGKEKSVGCPCKNTRIVLGRPMVEYPLIAAKNCKYIEKLFVSTDSPQIAKIGRRYGGEHIERPPELATPEALTEDVLTHVYYEIEQRLSSHVDIVVLLFANAPTIPLGMIDQGIEILQRSPSVDSCFSVCKYNMWSPLRARRLDSEKLIRPYVGLKTVGNMAQMSSIRGSEGDCYFVDLAVQVLRDRCFTNMADGQLPFKWMGKRSYALINDYGFDIDYEWQIPVIEHWLKEHGFTERTTPYDNSSIAK